MYSLTISGWLVGILTTFITWADISVASEGVTAFVQVGGALISAVFVYYGRYRKGDIHWWGGRK